ncbi:PAS domain-containing sensor histidine kinase [Pseudogemmobacter sp. W21_MBD1_M6]|uniref:PAS domain-containing sensor histidine kinase n=1 Tax=Pseudogemmobacter sp. W21_MBD1_M6 TaxID=3240271 RepID=UPI003F952D2A
MLTLILSKDLDLRFISPDATASFRPHPAHLDQPIEVAEGLMEVDPGLSLDCRAALRGGPAVRREINPSGGDGYLRRIMLRTTGGGKTEELVISYEPGVSAQRLELTQVRKHLADALDAVQDPFAYYDKHDCLVHFNQAYARLQDSSEGEVIAGIRFEEIVRRNLRSGLLGIPADQHEQWLRDRLAQRERQTFEREMRFRDGRWFRVTERSTAVGSLVHMLVDITDIKTAQVALQQVISGAQAAAWSVNLETGESDVNDRWIEMLGLDRQAVASLGFEGWLSLVHPDDAAAAEAGFLQCADGSADAFEVEYRLRHRLGHWVWVMGRGGVSDHHADGRPSGISGVLLDISRQKRLEAKLAMQSAAIAATEDGITITDEAGTILYTNPAHAAMFGHDDHLSLAGQSWHSLYSSQAAAGLAAKAFPALRAKGYWTGQVEALRADGGTFEQELSLTEMPDGKIVCLNRDVSARNAFAREQLQIRDRIELAQRQEILNLLAAGLTHDLSNLIAIILHFSDPALEEAGVQLPQALKNIHATARQAVSLLEPLRSLGTGKRETEETDLAELLSEAAGILKLGAAHNLKITVDLPDEPIIATVDPLKLMQVFLNLALNGRDALGDGEQEIALSLSLSDTVPQTAALEMGEFPDKPYALFRISDTGTGITPEVRARLWEPHFTTKGNMGTGLGLPVIAEIVRETGGAIALETAPGVGSAFYVAWPLTYPAGQEKKAG